MSYGVDNFMTIGLFYLMLSPLPERHFLIGESGVATEKCQLLGFWRPVPQLTCVSSIFSAA